jgi:hypothetical protein
VTSNSEVVLSALIVGPQSLFAATDGFLVWQNVTLAFRDQSGLERVWRQHKPQHAASKIGFLTAYVSMN